MIIRFTLEVYLEICLANMIKLYAINDKSWFELTGSTYSIIALSLMVIFCIATPIFLYKKSCEFDDQEFIGKFGALIQDMRKT